MRGRKLHALFGAGLLFAACGLPEYDFDGKDEDSGTIEAGSGGTAGALGTGGTGGNDASVDGSGGSAGSGGCTSNADCAATASTPVCDTQTSTCVECLPSNDTCPVGTYCSGTSCVVGCNDDADCKGSGLGMPDGGIQDPDGGTSEGGVPVDAGPVTLTCDLAQNLCVGCLYDWNCPIGTICNGATSTCIPGCIDASTCPTGYDCCDNQCVNPQTRVDHCGACGQACAPENGTGKCVDAACLVDVCDPGFGDCDANPANGCEATLGDDAQNCGGCGAACAPLANADPACSQGSCTLGPCKPGFQDCNAMPADGCEVNVLSNGQNCGSCGYACSLLNASAVCQAGVCSIANCNAGYANCDADVTNGCETNTQTDPQHCGSCTGVCQFANAAATCASGACQLGACASPFANCNANSADGCETNLNTSASNCGTCGKVCSSTNGTASCSGGVCGISCAAGYANCDGNADNGCETSLSTVTNCGSCGNVCSGNNGTPSCSSGSCAISCSSGYANCDGNVANGCETNTQTSVSNCGSCGNVCPSPGGATPNCVAGQCGISSCTAPYADCNGNGADGCEVNTNTSASNCGSCGNVCSAANGSAACNSGSCTVASCNSGFGNCDGVYANGCEKNLNTDPANCGSCGTVCSVANGSGACSNGSCTVASCNAGWANCDGLASNGCETNLNSTSNCGACGVACTNAHGTTSCSSGVCSPSCAAGWGNCNGNPNDGCETSLTTLSNCGSCGSVCDLQNASESCSTGSCQVTTCNAGYGNCDGSHGNGCEVNVQTSVPHCGGCTMACSSNNGSPSCSGGNCAISCSVPYANCDGNARSNGCEVNLSSNTSNCGACGNACAAGETCQAGSCTPASCNPGFVTCGSNVCTCEGTACCGTSCQVKHDTGLGQNWFDCVAYGTYNSVQASKACQAWSTATAQTTSCEQVSCNQGLAMCNVKGKACWGFDSQIVGKVYKGSGQFYCPISTDPSWDP